MAGANAGIETLARRSRALRAQSDALCREARRLRNHIGRTLIEVETAVARHRREHDRQS
jgi:hypothetical protein